MMNVNMNMLHVDIIKSHANINNSDYKTCYLLPDKPVVRNYGKANDVFNFNQGFT